MKLYDEEIKVGLKLIYDGEPKRWANPRTHKIIETMNRGKYVVTDIRTNVICVMPDRKNATTKHWLYRNEIEGHIYVPEWIELTTPIAMVFALNKNWYINDEELMKKAKAYNKRR